MPFVRLDPAWPRSPKLASLSRGDRLRWLELLSWCVEHRTDGAGNADHLATAWPDARAASRKATMHNLQAAGLVLPDPDAGPGAWRVHDFLVYQTSKEEDEERRLANRERQRRFRERHGQPSGAQNRQRQKARRVTRDSPGAVTALEPGGSNAPLPSPPSLTGGEEGTDTRSSDAARPTGGRSSSPRNGTITETAALARSIVEKLNPNGGGQHP